MNLWIKISITKAITNRKIMPWLTITLTIIKNYSNPLTKAVLKLTHFFLLTIAFYFIK